MKQVFTLLLLLTVSISSAQLLEDSVVMGPSYTNDIFYSFDNGEVDSYSGASWTVAFYNKSQSGAIMLNGGHGVELWNASDDIAQFANIIDTVGISSWTQLYDTDTIWNAHSAFEGDALNSQWNYGWGDYDISTHIIRGSRIFVLKSIEQNYFKVLVEKKDYGVFHYRYASLDNSFDTTIVVNVPDYSNKSYAYLNMDNHILQDREPNHSEWDLLFTKYSTDLGFAYYPVTGVVSNEGVEVAEIKELPNNASYTAQDFNASKTVIGTDGKTFDQNTFSYLLQDTLTYFVRIENGDVYKLDFTTFEGSSTGKIKFNKELVSTGPTGVQSSNEALSLHSIYPNPSSGSADIVFSNTRNENIDIRVFNLVGNLVYQANAYSYNGLNSFRINLDFVENGVYLVQIGNGFFVKTQKLVINN